MSQRMDEPVLADALLLNYAERTLWSQRNHLHDIGMSSANMWRQALGGKDDGWYAADKDDLGRCERLYERALLLEPELAAKMLPILERNRAKVTPNMH